MEGLVSVVVPIYNVEKYLDRCIASIVDQTYRNLEIILVDDGSPDNCPRICDAWAQKDARIRVIHKHNQGLGMARNTGIEHATGDYICFFDSDDYVDHETVEKAYKTAQRTRSDIVVFGMKHVNEDGEVTLYRAPQTPKETFCGKEVQEVFLPDLIDNSHRDVQVQNLLLSACSCLFSMDLIKKTKWRFVSERELISEDCYSLIWLYKHVQCVAVISEGLYYYQVNQKSLTHTFKHDRHIKNRHFYVQCSRMAEEQGMGEEVLRSIAALYLGFTIAALKHLAATKLAYCEKKQILRQMLDDSVLQSAIERIQDRDYGRMKNNYFLIMHHRLFALCYLLIKARNSII